MALHFGVALPRLHPYYYSCRLGIQDIPGGRVVGGLGEREEGVGALFIR